MAVDYDPAAVRPLSFDLGGHLRRGRWDDARLPHELSDIAADVRIDNDGITVTTLSARSGQAALRMTGRYEGLQAGSPLKVSAQLRRLELDAPLRDILPEALRASWNRYLPAGQVDANVTLDYDGRVWRPEVTLRCLNVSFANEKFPYRLERGEGLIAWKNDLLTLEVTAFGGRWPVHLTAVVAHPFSAATGWVEARGEEIQLDEALIAAMPEPQSRARPLARSPRPGKFLLAGLARRTGRRSAPAPPAGPEPMLAPLRPVSLLVVERVWHAGDARRRLDFPRRPGHSQFGRRHLQGPADAGSGGQ